MDVALFIKVVMEWPKPIDRLLHKKYILRNTKKDYRQYSFSMDYWVFSINCQNLMQIASDSCIPVATTAQVLYIFVCKFDVYDLDSCLPDNICILFNVTQLINDRISFFFFSNLLI